MSNTRWTTLLAATTWLLLCFQPAQSIELGETICAEGFILDNFCLYINLDSQGRGRLLDTNDIALEQPDRHTLHCLVDVGVCNEGPFFILQDPETEGGIYTVQYELNDHTTLLAMARAAGRRGGGCSTCEGGSGGLTRGLRAEVIGVVTAVGDAGSPTRIDMVSARVSNGLDAVCTAFQEGENTSPDVGTGTAAFWASFLELIQLLVAIFTGGNDG